MKSSGLSQQPCLFITSEGDYFSLRETFVCQFHDNRGRLRTSTFSFHHLSLGSDREKALRKADLIASQMQLKINAKTEVEGFLVGGFLWPKEQAEGEGRKRLITLLLGQYAFGPYEGKEFQEAPVVYRDWLRDNAERFEDSTLLKLTALEVIRCSQVNVREIARCPGKKQLVEV